MPRYAELVYNGFWFSPERRALQAAIDETQQFCSGTVRVKLYKVCSCSPSCTVCCKPELQQIFHGSRHNTDLGVLCHMDCIHHLKAVHLG